MTPLKALAAAGLVAIATACGGCNISWSTTTSDKGIEPNALTRAIEPITRTWGFEKRPVIPVIASARPAEVRWTGQKIWETSFSNATATLTGWARLDDGRKIPLEASFANDESGWRVEGVKSGDTQLLAPEWLEQSRLIRKTMGLVVESIRQKTFAPLYAETDTSMREEFTLAEIDKRMKAVLALKVDGQPLAGLTPLFAELPKEENPRVTRLVGAYDLGPDYLHFNLKFLKVGSEQKVIGWHIHFKPKEAEEKKTETTS